MKRLTSILLISLLSFIAFSQNNENSTKAKEILDKVSEKVKSLQTITAKFSFTMVNQQENIKENYKGTVYIKGEKYHLTLMGTETYCDGTTIWTHLVEDEEVNITKRDLTDNSFLNNPASIFTMYETGFKYKYIEKVKTDIGAFDKIELYPTELAEGLTKSDDVDNSDLSKVVIFIDGYHNQIHKIEYHSKNGNVYIVEISRFDANKEMKDSEFIFDKTKFPETEIIDLRE